ncbi:preprotein translocase subunit SecG [Lachnotalea sp. AF33-28]|jgi:preprotein translocase subunit SecG|uniref:preprotein translocase subunit SecG n=1 Tax=Lachnotalea sp. AF33-28 TaxID=2292046 RepID=UPI000E4A4ED7|nr:preprotein translocase subunit SecG [Lachnotalea sp. AF33-28]RHP34349.1 preprotein translocase subunit SecG [Lachnotalea sp. AF33-28]
MEIVKLIITVIFFIICVALSVIVLLQEGKSAGLTGSISGAAETFWGKNKGRTIEGKLEKGTKYIAIGFMVLALVLNIL